MRVCRVFIIPVVLRYCAADDGSEDDQLYCFHEHKTGIRLHRSRRDSLSSATTTLDNRSESASSQPCSSSAADDLDLEMCVDEIDESEDENNEVFVEADDDSDTD